VRDYLGKNGLINENWEQRPTYDELTDCTDIIDDKIYRFKEDRYDFWGSNMGENEGLFSIHDYGRMLCKVGVAERLGTLYKNKKIEMLDTLTLRLLTDITNKIRNGQITTSEREILKCLFDHYPNLARHLTLRYITEPETTIKDWLYLLTKYYNDLFVSPIKGHGIRESDHLYPYNVLTFENDKRELKTIKMYTPKKYNHDYDSMERHRQDLVLKYLGKISPEALTFLDTKMYKKTLSTTTRDKADEFFDDFPNLHLRIDVKKALEAEIREKEWREENVQMREVNGITESNWRRSYLLRKLTRNDIVKYMIREKKWEALNTALEYMTNEQNEQDLTIEGNLDKYFKRYELLLFKLIDEQAMIRTMSKHFNDTMGKKNLYIVDKIVTYNLSLATRPLENTVENPVEAPDDGIYLYHVVTYDFTRKTDEYTDFVEKIEKKTPLGHRKKYDDLEDKQREIREYLGISVKSEV
jgi:hypothetical protein